MGENNPPLLAKKFICLEHKKSGQILFSEEKTSFWKIKTLTSDKSITQHQPFILRFEKRKTRRESMYSEERYGS